VQGHCHVGARGVICEDRLGEHRSAVVQGSPLPGGGHKPVRGAVLQVSAELREVEELMLARGVMVSYETIRRWCAKFGQAYANGLLLRLPLPLAAWQQRER
jgi:hypothetical protein